MRSLEGNILYQDSADLRLEIEELLQTILQKSLATWASQNAQNYLEYIDIEDESLKDSIITEASKVLEERIEAKLSAHQLRQTGFLANKLGQQSINDISKFSVNVFAQAVATGHMRGHAIVSSDYAIKVVNILYLHDEQAAINEIILINLFTGKISRRGFLLFSNNPFTCLEVNCAQ
ncbi:hypothetical protein HW423_01715 [Aerococcaceae bacterium INB8]|uniref:Imm-5-like domain-containing protein n=1 Tax=Ruoffia halotolerans TaxID=2748684 RepID=A0A839A460_9LACT|nr:hypothetical protein [Ruoffia halotolerans]MBA5728503.1 hypothetical protein [Ruoffia halotolerans]